MIAEQGCKIPDVARNLGINERFFFWGGALAAEIGEGGVALLLSNSKFSVAPPKKEEEEEYFLQALLEESCSTGSLYDPSLSRLQLDLEAQLMFVAFGNNDHKTRLLIHPCLGLFNCNQFFWCLKEGRGASEDMESFFYEEFLHLGNGEKSSRLIKRVPRFFFSEQILAPGAGCRDKANDQRRFCLQDTPAFL